MSLDGMVSSATEQRLLDRLTVIQETMADLSAALGNLSARLSNIDDRLEDFEQRLQRLEYPCR